MRNYVLKYKSSHGEQDVPCKLNNAKTNKINTLDNYNGLFKRFRTNNSQRKFLSN